MLITIASRLFFSVIRMGPGPCGHYRCACVDEKVSCFQIFRIDNYGCILSVWQIFIENIEAHFESVLNMAIILEHNDAKYISFIMWASQIAFHDKSINIWNSKSLYVQNDHLIITIISIL